MIKEQLATVKDKLNTLKSFDRREHVNVYCDQLDCDVLTAFESARKRLNEIEQEMLKEIGDYRQKCLDDCSAVSSAQATKTTKDQCNSQSESIQKQIEKLEKEIGAFSEECAGYMGRLDEQNATATNKAHNLIKKADSLKRAIVGQVFSGKLMVFKPHTDFFDDNSHLKGLYNFKLHFESMTGW